MARINLNLTDKQKGKNRLMNKVSVGVKHRESLSEYRIFILRVSLRNNHDKT